ncbi:MAG: hypothetical protein AAGG56_01385 [Pseudomonadota bacterium]
MVPAVLIPLAIRLASEYVPALATKIVGKNAAKIAEEIVSVAANIAGKPGSHDFTEIKAGLAQNPSSAMQMTASLEELNFKYLEDMQDARRSQEARGGLRGSLMLGGVTLGLIACIGTVLYLSRNGGQIDQGVLALITTIAGALLKMFSDAFAFEFGSSRGSKEKDAQVSEFKQALLRVGEQRSQEVKEVIKEQREIVNDSVDRALGVKPGRGAPGGAQNARSGEETASPEKRNFVAALVTGAV